MVQTKAKVIKNIEVTKKYYKILLSCARIAKAAKPGQFLNVKITNSYEPLLRRPFSIHGVRGANIEILFEVVGKGTEILSQRKTGEYLDIVGPLGNGFNYTLHATRYTLPILVAGGMGVAPLFFLAESLKNHKVTVLIGAKTKRQVLCEKEFKELGCEVKIATEDGSKGFKGLVTELLRNELYAIRYTLYAIYGCGPRPMLKEVANISKKYNIPAQISLEEHMACGIGVCLGCVVKLRTPNSELRTDFEYKRVCKDGPVFDAENIIWE
jgi:dihydroorotate dehydrogenase electron transfer subunit